ncbi:hypothetical protein BH11MYX2_BH11MYX2_16940 [soil metagenome]
MEAPGFRIDWQTPIGELLAMEPRLDEVVAHVDRLAAAYNDPHNATLLGHTAALTTTDVVDHYESLRRQGAHPFLLFLDGELAGDGDIRGMQGTAAEFAFMIAAPAAQGKGLGTRFAAMIHAFAFAHLPLHTMYASIIPENAASRRVFEKLGYALDTSTTARSFADDEGDVIMSIAATTFLDRHRSAISQMRIIMR